MAESFYDSPILNSPYTRPARHWELDDSGIPSGRIIDARRRADFLTPIPKPRKQDGKKGSKKSASQESLTFGFKGDKNLSTREQQYQENSIINTLREYVREWRSRPNPSDWHVTPETARLLEHWRTHAFSAYRPFYCQLEAVETAIFLTEVAPEFRRYQHVLDHLAKAQADANPDLFRIALKLATGAGKTTVMAMLIVWQTINAVRRPNSARFTRGFLIVTPGITIRDRLRVLMPNDPDAYYASRELAPPDLLPTLQKARIVITNYHAFMLRETLELARGTRALLEGRGGEALQTTESPGQMLQRVMPELMSLKKILVMNDEAHHCYRQKPPEEAEELSAEQKDEAEHNNAAARVWISGLEQVSKHLGISTVFDLSATPFFLSGSGYAEGTLFPWTMSDFSLMDAIECGIVKLPRVPVADNIPNAEVPVYRNLWQHVGKELPRKGRAKGGVLDPQLLPVKLQTALQSLYGHYEKVFQSWQEAGISVPPCFIVVCNNTATSKLVFDWITGYQRVRTDGTPQFQGGHLPLFHNFDPNGEPLARPRTLLIDSEQLESGEGLDDTFRAAAELEIERFRRERTARGGATETLEDHELLREVMNTVGKQGRLGESIRCVVSVSMLTEGWDTNTVTHVLGIRAFGTQLLCEQVIGRALRRQSYDLNEQGLFNVEYADVLGIPFDFTARPQIPKQTPPRETITVKAISPERDGLEIQFPRVLGYQVELPEERLTATFSDDSRLVLTPELVGPTQTRNAGIIGQEQELTVDHLKDLRPATVTYHLTRRLLERFYRDEEGAPKLHLFGRLRAIAQRWLSDYLECQGETSPAQLLYLELADRACEHIQRAINASAGNDRHIRALVDPFNPTGSTAHVLFTTSKTSRWQTHPQRCPLNWVILDSDWEAELCRVVEGHPRVHSYVKNHNLGFEVPYQLGATSHRYRPDFIVQLRVGEQDSDLLNLIVEIKGFQGEDAKVKRDTMNSTWVPAINRLGRFGRWAFVELSNPHTLQQDFNAVVEGWATGGGMGE